MKILGATNRPHEIDEAARRRLSKRLYIPLPESLARKCIIRNLLKTQNHILSEEDLEEICKETEGYSGSDMALLCSEAAMGPIRCVKDITCVSLNDVRPIAFHDFKYALTQVSLFLFLFLLLSYFPFLKSIFFFSFFFQKVRASVSQSDLNSYLDWNKKFGSLG